jgi:hypothetical protein
MKQELPNMKKRLSILAAALAVALPALAADPPRTLGGADVTTVSSTVEAIDHATREVTLKGKDGKTVTFIVGPEVKNLPQVRKGDTVTMDYVQAVALTLKKTDNKTRDRTVTDISQTAAPGQMPAAIAGKHVKVVASVESMDAKTGIVILRGPQRTVELLVDKALLKNVKVGDMVEAEYAEAVAIKVERGAK